MSFFQVCSSLEAILRAGPLKSSLQYPLLTLIFGLKWMTICQRPYQGSILTRGAFRVSFIQVQSSLEAILRTGPLKSCFQYPPLTSIFSLKWMTICQRLYQGSVLTRGAFRVSFFQVQSSLEAILRAGPLKSSLQYPPLTSIFGLKWMKICQRPYKGSVLTQGAYRVSFLLAQSSLDAI